MPDRSSKRKKPADLNKKAFEIVAEATKERQPEEEPKKNPAAVELGRRGGLKGGKARAAKLSPARRQEIAKKAAETRWKKKP